MADGRAAGCYFLADSLHETVGAVDLAGAIGAIAPELAARAHELALRVKRMLRALMR